MTTKEPIHPRHLAAAEKAANEMCLRRLKDHGFVEAIRVDNDYPEVNVLSKAGADYILEVRQSDGDYRPVFWRANHKSRVPLHFHHHWLTNEILANLIGSFRLAGGKLEMVLGEDQLKSHIYTGQTFLDDIEPDGVLVMRFGSRLKSFLIEADTGSQSIYGEKSNRFELKIPKYGKYLKERFALDPFFGGFDRPMVNVVTEKPKRVEHLKEATFKQGGQRAYWFTSLQDITPPTDSTTTLATDPLWLVPTMDGKQAFSVSDWAT